MAIKAPLVLLLAGDRITEQMTARCLEAFGYDVITAFNGAEAIALLRSDRPIRILVADTDVTGEFDGLAVARAARDLNAKMLVIYTARVPHAIPENRKVKGAPCLRTPYPSHQVVSVLGELRGHRSSESFATAA